MQQWHHTCCFQHSLCWRPNEGAAQQHAEERATRLGPQRVRWSERMRKWVVENIPKEK